MEDPAIVAVLDAEGQLRDAQVALGRGGGVVMSFDARYRDADEMHIATIEKIDADYVYVRDTREWLEHDQGLYGMDAEVAQLPTLLRVPRARFAEKLAYTVVID